MCIDKGIYMFSTVQRHNKYKLQKKNGNNRSGKPFLCDQGATGHPIRIEKKFGQGDNNIINDIIEHEMWA